MQSTYPISVLQFSLEAKDYCATENCHYWIKNTHFNCKCIANKETHHHINPLRGFCCPVCLLLQTDTKLSKDAKSVTRLNMGNVSENDSGLTELSLGCPFFSPMVSTLVLTWSAVVDKYIPSMRVDVAWHTNIGYLSIIIWDITFWVILLTNKQTNRTNHITSLEDVTI